MAWKITCMECGKKETFVDSKDVTFHRWIILAWGVPSGEPKCVCDECDYGKSKEKPTKK